MAQNLAAPSDGQGSTGQESQPDPTSVKTSTAYTQQPAQPGVLTVPQNDTTVVDGSVDEGH